MLQTFINLLMVNKGNLLHSPATVPGGPFLRDCREPFTNKSCMQFKTGLMAVSLFCLSGYISAKPIS